jgi:hypothetical protein
MKKIASLLLMFFVLISCETDVTRNDPAFEGYKDDVRWKAATSYAELAANQSITITGIAQFETVTLQLQSSHPGTYALGGNSANIATYTYEDPNHDFDLAYTTASDNDLVDGEIVIEDFDPITMKISGTFRFNAENVGNNPLGGPLMNFQHGFFYKVPVVPAL